MLLVVAYLCLNFVGDEGLYAVVFLVDYVVDYGDGVGRAATLPQ